MRGGEWSPTRIRALLECPVYRGEFRFRGDVLSGTHEALVDDETWELAQGFPRQKIGRPSPHFTPLFTCGQCGGTMHAYLRHRRYTDGTPEDAVHYGCSQRERQPHQGIGGAEQTLMEMVYRQTELLLADADWGRAMEEAQGEPEEGAARAVRAALADLQRRRLINLEAAQRGAITMDDLERANAELMQEERALRAQEKRPKRPTPATALLLPAGAEIATFLASLRSLSIPDQVSWLQLLYPRLELHPGILQFHLPGETIARNIPRYYSPRRGLTNLGF